MQMMVEILMIGSETAGEVMQGHVANKTSSNPPTPPLLPTSSSCFSEFHMQYRCEFPWLGSGSTCLQSRLMRPNLREALQRKHDLVRGVSCVESVALHGFGHGGLKQLQPDRVRIQLTSHLKWLKKSVKPSVFNSTRYNLSG